jgi:hypothetical protein
MLTSAELVDCRSLKPGSVIDVETKSRLWQVECLGGDQVRISGRPLYCPRPVSAHLEGSLNPDGSLDCGLIECGMRLLFLVEAACRSRLRRYCTFTAILSATRCPSRCAVRDRAYCCVPGAQARAAALALRAADDRMVDSHPRKLK